MISWKRCNNFIRRADESQFSFAARFEQVISVRMISIPISLDSSRCPRFNIDCEAVEGGDSSRYRVDDVRDEMARRSVVFPERVNPDIGYRRDGLDVGENLIDILRCGCAGCCPDQDRSIRGSAAVIDQSNLAAVGLWNELFRVTTGNDSFGWCQLWYRTEISFHHWPNELVISIGHRAVFRCKETK